MSEANFKRLPFHGPKTLNGKDTVYYKVPSQFFYTPRKSELELDTANFPVYVIKYMFRKEMKDDYHLSQFSEFIKLRKTESEGVNFVVAFNPADSLLLEEFRKNYPETPTFYADSMAYIKNYLKSKPYFVLDGFFILIDKNRHIRGYYDGNYAAEMKRLAKEYQHLVLRDEQNQMLKENTIEQKQ